MSRHFGSSIFLLAPGGPQLGRVSVQIDGLSVPRVDSQIWFTSVKSVSLKSSLVKLLTHNKMLLRMV